MTTLNIAGSVTRAFALTDANGGATISVPAPFANTVSAGYGVAIKGAGITMSACAMNRSRRLTTFIENNRSILAATGIYLGLWKDVDGTLYVDITRVIPNRDEAIAIAEQTGEIAIWDFANNDEIRIGE